MPESNSPPNSTGAGFSRNSKLQHPHAFQPTALNHTLLGVQNGRATPNMQPDCRKHSVYVEYLHVQHLYIHYANNMKGSTSLVPFQRLPGLLRWIVWCAEWEGIPRPHQSCVLQQQYTRHSGFHMQHCVSIVSSLQQQTAFNTVTSRTPS